MSVTILQSTATLVMGQESDEIRALGMVAMLSGLANIYADQSVFSMVDRTTVYIQGLQYAIFYTRLDAMDTNLIPIGYVAWATLSLPAQAIFENRFRHLLAAEINSGSRFWVIDNIQPLGFFTECQALFEQEFITVPSFEYIRIRGGEFTRQTMPNSSYVP